MACGRCSSGNRHSMSATVSTNLLYSSVSCKSFCWFLPSGPPAIPAVCKGLHLALSSFSSAPGLEERPECVGFGIFVGVPTGDMTHFHSLKKMKLHNVRVLEMANTCSYA